MKNIVKSIGLVLALVALSACGSSNTTPPPVGPVPPTVEISAQPVTDNAGNPCIQFFGRFSETVQMFSVRVTLPLTNSFLEFVPTSAVTATPTLVVPFQFAGTCYARRSGLYRIEIQASRPNQSALTISATYNSPF